MPHTLLRCVDAVLLIQVQDSSAYVAAASKRRAFVAVALAEAVRRYVANPASRNGVVPAKGPGALSSQQKVQSHLAWDATSWLRLHGKLVVLTPATALGAVLSDHSPVPQSLQAAGGEDKSFIRVLNGLSACQVTGKEFQKKTRNIPKQKVWP